MHGRKQQDVDMKSRVLDRGIVTDDSPDVPRAGITSRTGRRGRLAEFGSRRDERRRERKQTRGARGEDAERHTPPHDDNSPKKGSFAMLI